MLPWLILGLAPGKLRVADPLQIRSVDRKAMDPSARVRADHLLAFAPRVRGQPDVRHPAEVALEELVVHLIRVRAGLGLG
jgi:hypothetical protein